MRRIKETLEKKRSLKNKKDFVVMLVTLVFFVTTIAFAIDSIYEGYRVTSSTKTINVWSKCKQAYISGGNNVFAPTRTEAEWDAFIASHPANVVLSNCSGGSNPVNGSCSSNHYNCIAGTSSSGSYTSGSPGYWTWDCLGLNGGSAASCIEYDTVDPINGICDTTHYNCLAGSPINQSDNATNWTWTCAGSNGGLDASCSEDKPVVPIVSGCFIDTMACDIFSSNFCFQTEPNLPGRKIIFSVGNVNYSSACHTGTQYDRKGFADPSIYNISWTGDCIGSGTSCSLTIPSYAGSRTTSVVVKKVSDGSTVYSGSVTATWEDGS